MVEADGGRGEADGASRRRAMTTNEVNLRLNEFLLENKVKLRINDAAREHGQIRAFQNNTYDITKVVPTVVMRNEDYGRIARILEDGTPVELQFTIVNTVYPDGRTAYNTISEIAGSDKKDEVVMLGGHLDSWHSATGATDNAIGCAVMMEAARILKAIGVQPRRTIRVALWSGEEQGLLGSLAYVKEHFGTFEAQKPEYAKLVAYLNIDSGTGRARGAGVFGPPEAAAIIRELLKPFEDFGVDRRVGRRAAAPSAAPIRRPSTTPGSPASASGRTRSNTTATPGTRTSTPTSGSSSRTRSSRRSRSRRCSITSRCATRCCRASPRPRCRRCRKGGGGRGN